MKVGESKPKLLSGFAKSYLVRSKQFASCVEDFFRRYNISPELLAWCRANLVPLIWVMCVLAVTSNTLDFVNLLERGKLERAYQYNSTPLPSSALQKIGLVCDGQGTHTVVAGDSEIELRDVMIVNESDVLLLINAGGVPSMRWKIRMRPRLWDAQAERYLQDGLPGVYSEKISVLPKTTVHAKLAVSGRGINPELIGDDSYLEFDVVQEGVAWAGMESKCRFKVVK